VPEYEISLLCPPDVTPKLGFRVLCFEDIEVMVLATKMVKGQRRVEVRQDGRLLGEASSAGFEVATR